MKVMLDEGAKMPTRAHETDAGLDLYARNDAEIHSWSSAKFDTGVHVEIPVGYVGMLKSKSGLNVNHGIQSEGVIDAGYNGSIVVKLFNNSPTRYVVKKGDKISQLVIMPIVTPTLELVDSLEDTERGDGGFGSTGRKGGSTMPEYIEREALVDRIKNEIEKQRERGNVFGATTLAYAKVIVEKFQTADVAEVVRCKDCNNSADVACGVLYCCYFNKNVEENDYCSNGF